MFRKLSEAESQLIQLLLAADFPEVQGLRAQVPRTLAKRLDADGSLELRVQSLERANIRVRVPVEAEYEDDDGVTVHVLLHASDGFLSKLEVFKEDASPTTRAPTAEKLRVLLNPTFEVPGT